MVDEANDMLSQQDQKGAALVLRQELEKQGRTVGADDCSATWTVSHAKLGNLLTVQLKGPDGTETLQAQGLEELPAVYRRLVKAILTGQSPEAAVDRTSVTDAEANPKRVAADNLSTVFIGGSGMFPGYFAPGIAMSGGYRAELDRIAVDFSARLAIPTVSMADSGDGSVMFGAGVGVLGFFKPDASTTPYAGGGLGLGMGGLDSFGYGLNVDGTIGLAFLRESRLRMFTELVVSVPTWTTFSGEWIPTASLMLGMGFEPPSRGRR